MNINKTALLASWFKNVIKTSSFHTEWIKLTDSSHWRLVEGKIAHRSGRFFNIVGIRYKEINGRLHYQPFIEQGEIGRLGFLLRNTNNRKEILVQAKIEPGNVNVVQLSPTCQATKSNLLRIHGGLKPPFSEVFEKRNLEIIHSSLQSEQGSRFLGKRNRNVLALTKESFKVPLTHRWMTVDSFLNLLVENYLVNTDARSVLTSSPWCKLVNREPFTRNKTSFSKELRVSYRQKTFPDRLKKIKKDIWDLRKPIDVNYLVLNKLVGWTVTDKEISPLNKKNFRIKFLRIIAKNREVAQWDQPIITSYCQGRVELICGRINGVLHFHFKPVTEPGLYNITELSPTVCIEPGEKKEIKNIFKKNKYKVIASVLQSDEGGRFYKDITCYKIVDIGRADRSLKGFWLNLSEIQSLILEDGWFTNESRSAISILLSWL